MELEFLHHFRVDKSPLNQIDPKLKIILATLLTIFILYTWNLTTLAIISITLILLTYLLKVNLSEFKHVLEGVTTFLLIFTITLTFTYSRHVVYLLNLIPISLKGLELGLDILCKATSILLVGFVILKTTYLPDLIKTFRQFKLPKTIVWIFVLVFKYLLTELSVSLWYTYSSARLRGLNTSLRIENLKNIGILITSFLIRAIDKYVIIENAFKLRVIDDLPDYREYTFKYKIVNKHFILTLTPLFIISISDIAGCIPCPM